MAPIALSRGLSVLDALARRDDGMAFGEIAERLTASNTSTMRLLRALEELGYVRKGAEDGRYRPGDACARLARPTGVLERLRPVVHPFLHELRARTGNSAMAIAWTGEHMLCLDSVVAEQAIPLQIPGAVSSNYRYCPWGWFFKGASYWSDERAEDFDSRHRAVPALSLIRGELERLERDGFCAHWRHDRRRLAAPISAAADGVIGALVLGGGAQSLPDERMLDHGRQVAAAARSCSRLVG